MAYMGTAVVSGRATALVAAVGMDTELGRIASMLGEVEREPTPLQRQLASLGRALALAALGVVAVFFALGFLRGEPARLMFLTAVSMAVAAVPEGLPAVVTVGLALAAQRMLARRALIRRLPAVETLGSVTVICSDKTGTLTENRMTATELDAPEPPLLLAAAALCGDAFLDPEPGPDGRARAVGDPTEGALVAAAADAGLPKPGLERALPRRGEIPFDSARKRMVTLHALAGPPPAALRGALGPAATGAVFAKGSTAALLGICSSVWEGGRAEPLTEERRRRWTQADDRLARRGMRVLGAAFKPFSGSAPQRPDWERGLTFLGLAGLSDPPRAAARGAVDTCRAAGVRPVMITGDHPLTALSVAQSLGLAGNGRVVTGAELSGLDDAGLARAVRDASVFARVAPEHKLRIVTALQDLGEVVAMTGDGVNDAPALKKADIGVAMGLTGTDAAKEAAAMILLDDDFATIVAAVKEGRVVYDNVRKFVRYLMATNAGELWVMLLAPFLGLPLPLLPLQILWINLATDGLPALALGFEPAESDAMSRPPRRPGARLFDRGMAVHVLWVGLFMAAVCLAEGWLAHRAGRASWQTMVLVTMVFAQLGNALAVRSERTSFFALRPGGNLPLLGAVALTALAQLPILYAAPLRAVFHTVALTPVELAAAAALGTLVFWAAELEKALRRAATRGR